MSVIIVIKGKKRMDIWDYTTNVPITDDEPIGMVRYVEGAIPEGYIKYVPNKIFDRRKYPELYALFGKDHLPNETELNCFITKHKEEWFPKDKNVEISDTTIFILTLIITLIMIFLMVIIII